jgi:hypothetical protein
VRPHELHADVFKFTIAIPFASPNRLNQQMDHFLPAAANCLAARQTKRLPRYYVAETGQSRL